MRLDCEDIIEDNDTFICCKKEYKYVGKQLMMLKRIIQTPLFQQEIQVHFLLYQN